MFDDLEPERLAALAPGLTLGGRSPRALPSATSPQLSHVSHRERARLDLSGAGWFAATEIVPPALALALADGLDRLSAAALPPTALYVFDEVWDVGESVRSLVSGVLGSTYALVADAWAFRVPPGERGWPAHRGIYERLDRARPEYVNVWVALSDVEVDRACIGFVPLDADPAYGRGALEAVEVPEGGAVMAPVRCGTALVWNANILHWGGPAAVDAAGPRYSITFTLWREGAAMRSLPLVDPEKLDPWRRLELVAEQISVYGDADRSLAPRVRAWAARTVEMRRLLRS